MDRGAQGGIVEKGAMKKKWVEELTNLGRESVPEVKVLGRTGKVPGADVHAAPHFQDVAKTVSFLASEESEFLTGQTIVCDGGMQCESCTHSLWTLAKIIRACCEDA